MRKVLLFFLILFPNCKILSYLDIQIFPIKGEFAWRAVDQSEFTQLEKKLFQPEEFYSGRENLYFGNHHTIWWLYKFDENQNLHQSFVVVLYSFTNPAEPIEIDLRELTPEFQDDMVFLKQYYNPLPVGKYQIKIALKKNGITFESVEFFVIPSEGISQISGPVQ